MLRRLTPPRGEVNSRRREQTDHYRRPNCTATRPSGFRSGPGSRVILSRAAVGFSPQVEFEAVVDRRLDGLFSNVWLGLRLGAVCKPLWHPPCYNICLRQNALLTVSVATPIQGRTSCIEKALEQARRNRRRVSSKRLQHVIPHPEHHLNRFPSLDCWESRVTSGGVSGPVSGSAPPSRSWD